MNNSKKDLKKDILLKSYSIEEALKILRENSKEKFDPSIEISFNLNLNIKKVEQNLRGTVVLPNGNGKVSKVLVITDEENFPIAKKSGADYVENLEIMSKIEKENWFDFDFIVTTPSFMPKLAKYGRVLGPKGLMPNPKLGTVTNDIQKAVENIKKGQVEYRANENGLINLSIGKRSFEDVKLIENYKALFKIIKNKKPSTVKGDYIINITLSSTMGPGIKLVKEI